MKYVKWVVLTLLIILITQAKTISADNRDVVVYYSATEYDYPPFSVTDDGEADGFSVELMNAVAEEMGIQIEWKIDQWTVLKEALKNGELDMLPLVGYTEERDQYYDFTVPYIVMRGNIFVREDNESITSQDDLFGKEILVLDGDNSQEWGVSIGLDEELIAVATYTEAFILLSDGNYDAVLANGLVGEKILDDNNIENVSAVYVYDDDGINRFKLNLDGYEQKFSFAVQEGNSELLSLLNEGLSIVSQNGTYDELYQKWFPFLIEEEKVSIIQVISYAAFIIFPVVLIILITNYLSVKRKVSIKTAQLEKNSSRNRIILDAFNTEFLEEERYDYILNETINLTESYGGMIISYSDEKNYHIITCSNECSNNSKLHQAFQQYFETTHLYQKLDLAENNVTNSVLISSDLPDIIQAMKLKFMLAVKMEDKTNQLIIVLFNRKNAFNQDDIEHVQILSRGFITTLEKFEITKQIRYLSFHDTLTNLYNRNFFEEQIRRLDNKRNLPITIIMGDVNGLKLVNDAFGHTVGDNLLKNIATILDEETRDNDIVARWGGDEFAMILIDTNTTKADILIKRLNTKIKAFDFDYGPLSISFGYETKINSNQNIFDVFKEAERMMYQRKMAVAESVRSETINTILDTLFEKSPDTKNHSERVSYLASEIAKALMLSPSKIADIETIARLHDIGKIIIGENILNKPTLLTSEERETIERHPVTASKMLASSSQYSRLVNCVLHHHERIDGKGYPNQLSGDEIPLESKIIAIADAFDAMTAKRPYRIKPLSNAEAVHEIKININKQFDEKIARVFVTKVLNYVW